MVNVLFCATKIDGSTEIFEEQIFVTFMLPPQFSEIKSPPPPPPLTPLRLLAITDAGGVAQQFKQQ